MHNMVSKQLELELEAMEWKEQYARDSPFWTEHYEKEHMYHHKDQIEASERLSKAMIDAWLRKAQPCLPVKNQGNGKMPYKRSSSIC